MEVKKLDVHLCKSVIYAIDRWDVKWTLDYREGLMIEVFIPSFTLHFVFHLSIPPSGP